MSGSARTALRAASRFPRRTFTASLMASSPKPNRIPCGMFATRVFNIHSSKNCFCGTLLNRLLAARPIGVCANVRPTAPVPGRRKRIPGDIPIMSDTTVPAGVSRITRDMDDTVRPLALIVTPLFMASPRALINLSSPCFPACAAIRAISSAFKLFKAIDNVLAPPMPRAIMLTPPMYVNGSNATSPIRPTTRSAQMLSAKIAAPIPATTGANTPVKGLATAKPQPIALRSSWIRSPNP